MVSKSVCMFLVYVGLCCFSAEPLCVYQDNKITCHSIRSNDVFKNITALIHKDSITSLVYKNSDIPTINRTTFGKYKYMYALDLADSHVKYIQENAFVDLKILKALCLKDNYIRMLNSNIFGSSSSVPVEKLDLSNNLLEDLSDFNITNFSPNLKLNISHNKLEYLPENFLEKLKADNMFYLTIDNNPWNCSHPRWKNSMDQILIDAFCTNKTYRAKQIEEKEGRLMNIMSSEIEVEIDPKESAEVIECSFKLCYGYCMFWFFGAIWIGIIIGNVCKIKKMVCRSYSLPVTLEHKYTQYDILDLKKP